MGALFALFNTNELKNFELNWKDIEKSQPVDAALFAECRKLLQTCEEMQASIDNYEGAMQEIKVAMSAQQSMSICTSLNYKVQTKLYVMYADTDEQKEAIRDALNKVIPNAALCQSWMQFAQKVSKFLTKRLLPRLSAPIIANETHKEEEEEEEPQEMEQEDINYNDEEEKKQEKESEKVSELTILTHQALVHELALILDFLITFDQKKMMQPQIQNDFSFYKRSLSKQNEAYLSDLEWSVSNEKAGFVSMFLAQAIPLQKEVATQLANNQQSLKVLAIFCNACLDLLKENKFTEDEESQWLALRAMTAAFVIYDHGNANGAFQRNSHTKAQKVISMIAHDYVTLYGEKEHEDIKGLVNIIKFATMHFNDAGTSASIKNLLDK